MKQATKAIINILSACKCDPVATTDANGNDVIKVNAPTINDLPDFTDPWTAFFEMD